MKTTDIRNIQKDVIRPKRTLFPILVNYKLCIVNPQVPKAKNNRIMIPVRYPPMTFIFLILITRLLKCSFNYFRAFQTFQCHVLKVKFAVSLSFHDSPNNNKKFFLSSKSAIYSHSRKQIEMYWSQLNEIMENICVKFKVFCHKPFMGKDRICPHFHFFPFPATVRLNIQVKQD